MDLDNFTINDLFKGKLSQRLFFLGGIVGLVPAIVGIAAGIISFSSHAMAGIIYCGLGITAAFFLMVAGALLGAMIDGVFWLIQHSGKSKP